MSARGWMVWLAATLAVAALVHGASLLALPYLIEAHVLQEMDAPNAMHYGKRPDESTRGIVRPSPDLLYAVCPFDLAHNPLEIVARVPHFTYWSISGFDAQTNNFFVRNDGQIAGSKLTVRVLPPGSAMPSHSGAADSFVTVAPTRTGVFLIRSLINGENNLAALDAIRRQSSCRTVAASNSR